MERPSVKWADVLNARKNGGGATIHGETVMTRLAVVLAAVSAVIGPLSAQQSASFEVVSIKRSPSDAPLGRAGLQPGGRYVMINGPSRLLINIAYPTRTNEVVNAPDWVTYENYDVEAVATPTATYDQIAQMMRSMLTERFKLVAHYENRLRPIYTLMLAREDGKLGPNIRRSISDCTKPDNSPKQPPAPDGPVGACSARFTRGSMEASGFSMEALASNLAGPSGRVVVDKTGLTGDYDFTLRYSPELASRDGTPNGEPSLFTALREQLGLKLQDSATVLPVVVIDRIERPTPD